MEEVESVSGGFGAPLVSVIVVFHEHSPTRFFFELPTIGVTCTSEAWVNFAKRPVPLR